MPTLIQTLYDDPGGPSSSLVFTGVQVGDTLLICGISFNGVATATCIDPLGFTTFTGPYVSSSGGFGVLYGFRAVSTVAGTVTAILTGSGGANFLGVGLNYRGMPAFDQCATFVGNYSPLGYNNGIGSGPFTLADTTVVSFVYDETDSPLYPVMFSLSGDTLVYETPPGNTYVFQRSATGPGSSRSLFGSTVNNGPNLLTFSFSQPLTRPGGTIEQYALRGGQGFESESTPITQNKLPIVASFPYLPLMGSVICVGAAYSACSPALTAGDAYGNTYTKAIVSIGSGTAITLWYALVAHLPPAGQVFQVKITGDPSGCPGVAYQTTLLGIAEKVISSITGVATAGWNTAINSPPDQAYVSDTINDVAASTYLFGFVAGGPDINQTGMTWAALDGYTIQQQQTFIQFPFALTNDNRIGPGAILTKFVLSFGNYDVRAIGTTAGTFNEGGSIALLALTIGSTLTLPCPLITSPAVVGQPFTETLIASGGTPPYTYGVAVGYTLPPGLTLDPATGIISGIPTTAGDFEIAYTVTDSLGNTAQTIGTCPIPIGQQGSPCSNPVTNPALDSYLELRKVLVAWKKETHLPIRGKS